MAAIMTGLLIFTGLAMDTGRAYVVKAQLTKAVDGAALAAARKINSGDPRGEAVRIFKANFPSGFLGTTSAPIRRPPQTSQLAGDRRDRRQHRHGDGHGDVADDVHEARQLRQHDGGEHGEAHAANGGPVARARRVELDRTRSGRAVRDAARSFINSFDQPTIDSRSLTFGNGAAVLDPMPSSRGFNKTKLVMADVPSTLPGGSTNMVEGLYRGWDELRSVPRRLSSRAFASSCSSPTARPTACPSNYDTRRCGQGD